MNYLNSSSEGSGFRVDPRETLARAEIGDFNYAAVCVHQNVVAFDICWIFKAS